MLKIATGAAAGLAAAKLGEKHAEGVDQELENKVIVPGLVVEGASVKPESPQENDAEKDQFKWTQEEVLMGIGAGFESARKGEPIKVWFSPEVTHLVDMSSLEMWNELAEKMGRKDDLFVYKDEAVGSQIYVLPSPNLNTFVDPFDSKYGQYKTNPEGPFSWVNIQCATEGERPINNKILLHEIGHALGFVDFVTKFMYENPESLKRYINAQPGFLEDKPMKSVLNYSGEYLKEGQLGPHDGNLLAVGGYIV